MDQFVYFSHIILLVY